ncbi:septum formation protein Maf [Paroceanicella profunda]|uniref:Nucleoside triphosphate pyrophosphatase n=1 Tax=Paroceanicella profunda TaxID=2579971 RepID=A0A5B8FVC5_9RHOB|nr:Maf family protein [Paroceanicella profunda]QDL91304.1 septum formation protein Maf [Paroceanicella profunda]
MSNVILASRSAARVQMLRDAGVPFEAVGASVDEDMMKAALAAEALSPRDIADALAEAKALKISRRHPEALVIGADQVLDLDGRLFDKPDTVATARAHLLALRGKTHVLHSAAVIARGGAPVWRHVGRARLSVRPFSDAFLDDYLDIEGEAVLGCVGAYRLEGPGVQLFSRVEGDHFTVLGLPLLETLDYLRTTGALLS